MVVYLLVKGVKVDVWVLNQQMVLMLVVKSGNVSVVRLLLNVKVDVEFMDQSGEIVLMLVQKNNNSDIVWLIEYLEVVVKVVLLFVMVVFKVVFEIVFVLVKVFVLQVVEDDVCGEYVLLMFQMEK